MGSHGETTVTVTVSPACVDVAKGVVGKAGSHDSFIAERTGQRPAGVVFGEDEFLLS